MEQIINMVTGLAAEIIVLLLGTVATIVLAKVKAYVETLKQKDQTGIIDKVTDFVVDLAEAELTGEPGHKKRDFAIDYAIKILKSKGINPSKVEIISGIENAVRKLNEKK